MAASVEQAGRLTAAGQLTDNGVAGATLKVEVHCLVSQPSVAEKVKLSEVPLHRASAGRAGMVAILVVGLHPPFTENPVFQAS